MLKINNSIFSKIMILFFLLLSNISAQNNFIVDYDTVKAQKFDTGKMWTFEYAPVDYFNETYGFSPTQEWLDDVRLSALRFGFGCTASFVSGDGLIMTNHHCVEGILRRVQQEGEDLFKNGYYAQTINDERKVPRLFVDQLVNILDVTNEIHAASEVGDTYEEKVKNKEAKMKELVDKYNEEWGLNCRIATLYNGGKYSLYGYKRYEDVRLVFAPEKNIGYFGGDLDNFTYPRYNLDCSFLRVYDENGQPFKSNNYFEWSEKGIDRNEVMFVIGNPGRTNRLKSVAQLEFFRDVDYRNQAFIYDNYYKELQKLEKQHPERAEEIRNTYLAFGNGQKVITNIYKGLIDPYLMARKRSFEKNLKNMISQKNELKEKYSSVWESIENTRNEYRKIAAEINAFTVPRLISSYYFKTAASIYDYAKEMKKPEEERKEEYKGDKLKETIQNILNEKYDKIIDDTKLLVHLEFMKLNLGENNEIITNMIGNMKTSDAVESLSKKTLLTDKEKIKEIMEMSAEEILKKDDPFIKFFVDTRDKLEELNKLYQEIMNTEAVSEQLLGRAIFEVYGTSIPPDATGTLRIGDGILKGFEYNGTMAPMRTTFYGMYDRFNSNYKEYPWDLPERWINYDENFDLTTPFNLSSSHDIVGGSSGSAVINKEGEVVGLAFDGNIKSIIGNFIYDPTENRMISVNSQAMLEAFRDIYKAKRLADEIVTGKISE